MWALLGYDELVRFSKDDFELFLRFESYKAEVEWLNREFNLNENDMNDHKFIVSFEEFNIIESSFLKRILERLFPLRFFW